LFTNLINSNVHINKEQTLRVKFFTHSFLNATLCGKSLTRTELFHMKFLIHTASKDVFYDLDIYTHLLNDPMLSIKTTHSADQGTHRSHLATQGHFRHPYGFLILTSYDVKERKNFLQF
jgi:hypothetical protein